MGSFGSKVKCNIPAFSPFAIVDMSRSYYEGVRRHRRDQRRYVYYGLDLKFCTLINE